MANDNPILAAANRNPFSYDAPKAEPTATDLPASAQEAQQSQNAKAVEAGTTRVNPVPTNVIIDKLQKSGAQAEAAGRAAIATARAAEETISPALEASMRATNEINLQNAKAELESQNARVEVFKQAGGVENLYQRSQEIKTIQDEAAKQGADIVKLQQRIDKGGFWNEFFGTLQMKLVEIPQAERLNRAASAASQRVVEAELANTASAKIIANSQETLTIGTLKALEEKQNADLQIKLEQRKVDFAAKNAEMYQANWTRTAEQAKIYNSMAYNEYQQRALGLQIEAIEKDKLSNKRRAELANLHFEQLGIATRYDETDIAAIDKTGGDTLQRLSDAVDGGITIRQMQTPAFGNSFSESVANVETIRSGFTVEHAPRMAAHMNTILGSVQGTLVDKQGKPVKISTSDLHKRINEANAKFLEAQRKELPKSGQTLFAMRPLGELGSIPAVQNMTIYKDLLAPVQSVLDRNERVDEQKIVDLVTQHILQGKISREQAAKELSDLFTISANVNTDAEQFARYNIPPQNSYNIRLDSSRFHINYETRKLPSGETVQLPVPDIRIPFEKLVGRSAVYNLMDETSVLKLLVMKAPAKQPSESVIPKGE